MKKFVYSIVFIIGLWMGFVSAQSISFVPQGGSIFGYGCTVPIDVYINTNGQEISAVDLVMESSMDYVDFVPSDFVPYFFKPVVKANGLIHVVGFTVDPSERVNGEGKMGTIYLKPKQGDVDGIVRLYFLGEGETSDTNLSIAGGIDVLKEIGQASVKFSKDLSPCIVGNESGVSTENIQVEEKIDGGFADLTYDEVLEKTIKTIDKKHGIASGWFAKCKFVRIFLILILIIIILLLLKKEKDKGNKNGIKQ